MVTVSFATFQPSRAMQCAWATPLGRVSNGLLGVWVLSVHFHGGKRGGLSSHFSPVHASFLPPGFVLSDPASQRPAPQPES